jgi:hypothetical protein
LSCLEDVSDPVQEHSLPRGLRNINVFLYTGFEKAMGFMVESEKITEVTFHFENGSRMLHRKVATHVKILA